MDVNRWKKEFLCEFTIEEENGTIIFYKGEYIHRDNGPAIISKEGLFYYKEGKPHREGDEPAAIYFNGKYLYYKEGKKHREGDKPAVIHPNGTCKYYLNGQLHRNNGPAAIYPDGYRVHYLNGVKQCEYCCIGLNKNLYNNIFI